MGTLLTLSTSEDISTQKRTGDMANVQVAVRGRRRDRDNELISHGWSPNDLRKSFELSRSHQIE
ncbi:hypothetical protein D3C76_1435070 [compost metagenome]